MANRKPVKGYEGYYEVSDDGFVYSLARVVYKDCKKLYTKPEKVMSEETTAAGYKRVILSKNGKAKKTFLHRVVAEAFLENKENKPQVNHIDGVPSNNNIKNIEWCTAFENKRHAIEILGLDPRKQITRIPDDLRQKIKDFYVYGSSQKGCVKTAERFGVGKQTVLNIVKGG